MAKFFFYYSAMNAGKSTMLLQASFNYKERGMNTLLFSPSIDHRYGEGKITSRIGLQESAIAVKDEMDLFEYIDQQLQQQAIACILVDEVHLLKKSHIFQLARVVDQFHIPVLAYGLRTDFRAEPFEASSYLLALADQLVEVKTVCHCGKKASMNMRVGAQGQRLVDGDQIQIGGNDMYVATCREHFFTGVSGR
jgi:thymidine kinase